MNNTILNAIKTNFSNDFKNKTSFNPTDAIISNLFDIINDSGIFKPKLDKSKVSLEIRNATNNINSKGQFFESPTQDGIVVITIIKSPIGDNFQKIVSTLCHEMIHMYDYFYGQMHLYIAKCSKMQVLNTSSKQIVNGVYDVHGRFFQTYINKFKEYGITVKIKYSSMDVSFMKKLKESNRKNVDPISYFYNNNLNETDDISKNWTKEDLIMKKKLEQRAAMFKCNDGPPKLIFIDKDHWAIAFD